MTKFARTRTLDEIDAACAARGWILDKRRLNAGADGVSFRWKVGKTSGIAVINTFNGRLTGQTDTGLCFTSDEVRHDRKPWFKALLNVAFVGKEPAVPKDSTKVATQIEQDGGKNTARKLRLKPKV